MERRGVRTERGDANRRIEITNREIRRLRARVIKLDKWIAEETANTAPPTLADVISEILARRGLSKVSLLKAASQTLIFLQENRIADMDGLERKVKSMSGKLQSVRDELKPVERRLNTLDEHIRQAEIYLAHKNKKALTDSEGILFGAARKYLSEHLNGRPLDLKKWKAERAEKAAAKDRLYREYYALKEETQKVERIQRSVREIIRTEPPDRAKPLARGTVL
jgi:hypothetical protein